MLDTGVVLWLQAHGSAGATGIMQAVSVLGYVPSCLAAALVCGYVVRLRLGLTLILAIVLADAMTVTAKGAFASPRPHAVDARVRTFEPSLSEMSTATSVPADRFGFPSGHVATTAAWVLGLAWYRRAAWPLALAATWVALMALSRMYLGRHFPADVLGGLAVGAAGLAIARVVLAPVDEDLTARASGTTTAIGVAVVAFVGLAAVAGAALGAHDAGRFAGLVGAVLFLTRRRAVDDAVPPSARMARLATALVLLAVALWSSTWIPPGPGLPVVSTMALSAVWHASALLVPTLGFDAARA